MFERETVLAGLTQKYLFVLHPEDHLREIVSLHCRERKDILLPNLKNRV